MIQIPNKIINIIYISSSIMGGIKHINYIVNKNEKDNVILHMKLPGYSRPLKNNDIISSDNEFINGFKVVQTNNGEFAYIRQIDNQLLPYRYDIAGDFNEYGLAMVAKDGYVNWINTNFEYLSNNGTFIQENIQTNVSNFLGWKEIYDFNKGSIPLSKIMSQTDYENTFYLDTNGNIKEFIHYDQANNELPSTTKITNGTEFNEQNVATCSDKILFANGYYSTLQDMINFSLQNGWFENNNKTKVFNK